MTPQPDVAEQLIRQGQVWLVALGAGRPGEPAKNRPAVVVSVDEIQSGAATDLISVVPLTTSRQASPLRPQIPAGQGVDRDCVAVCDGVRAVVRSRFLQRLGTVPTLTMSEIMQARAAIEWYGP